jgi:hypothetical protein
MDTLIHHPVEGGKFMNVLSRLTLPLVLLLIAPVSALALEAADLEGAWTLTGRDSTSGAYKGKATIIRTAEGKLHLQVNAKTADGKKRIWRGEGVFDGRNLKVTYRVTVRGITRILRRLTRPGGQPPPEVVEATYRIWYSGMSMHGRFRSISGGNRAGTENWKKVPPPGGIKVIFLDKATGKELKHTNADIYNTKGEKVFGSMDYWEWSRRAYKGIPAGRYCIVGRARGYLPASTGFFAYTPAPRFLEIKLRLEKGHIISGVVLDSGGQPPNNLYVEAVPETPPAAPAAGDLAAELLRKRLDRRKVEPGRGGVYEIHLPFDTTYRVSLKGFFSDHLIMEKRNVAAGSTDVNFTMPHVEGVIGLTIFNPEPDGYPYDFHGVLLDEKGTVVSGADYCDDSTIAIPYYAPGTYYIVCYDFENDRVVFVRKLTIASGVRDIDLDEYYYDTPGWVRVSPLDADTGKKIPGAKVVIKLVKPALPGFPYAFKDLGPDIPLKVQLDGIHSEFSLFLGTYSMKVTAPGYEPVSIASVVIDRSTSSVWKEVKLKKR